MLLLPLLLLVLTAAPLADCLAASSHEPAISTPTVLLPASSQKISYVLKGVNGCFQWELTGDLVDITPLYEGQAQDDKGAGEVFADPAALRCSTGVVISTKGVVSKRESDWLIATDTVSGKVLRVEVFVDEVSRIEIETTTRTMYRGDLEDLHIHAFDSEGNLFNTLAGLSFRWSILPLSTGRSNILKFVSFRHVSVDADPAILALEERGLRGSAVLVQALELGRVNLTAVQVDSDIQASVVLSVYFPLRLSPPGRRYVVPGTRMQYKLQTQSLKEVVDLPMPNSHYKWQAENPEVLRVDEVGLVIAKRLGHSDISALNLEMAGNRATSTIYVVNPSHLRLELFPADGGRNAASTTQLVTNKEYIAHVFVLDDEGNRLSFTEQLEPSLTFPSDWRTRKGEINENGERNWLVSPTSTGKQSVSATLTHALDASTSERYPLDTPLDVQQDVFVTLPLSIRGTSSFVLPEGPDGIVSQPLYVEGGSGLYNFYSSNKAVASVDARGFVTPRSIGVAQLAAVDQANPQNKVTLDVDVARPDSMAFLSDSIEAKLGERFELPLAIFDDRGRLFTNCSSLPVDWQMSNGEVLARDHNDFSLLAAESCTHGTFKATKTGRSVITVRYGNMTRQIAVRVYDPVTIEGSSTIANTVGSSSDVHFRGGPAPENPNSYFSELVPENTAGVRVTPIDAPDGRTSFRVLCLKVHTQRMQLRVGHRPTDSNTRPAQSGTELTVICGPPARLLLYPVPRAQDDGNAAAEAAEQRDPSCTRVTAFASLETLIRNPSSDAAKYQVLNDENVLFAVAGFTADGLEFSNITSLVLEYVAKAEPTADEVRFSADQVLHVRGYAGKVVSFVRAGKIESPSVELQVVPPLSSSGTNVALYNHPDSARELTLSGGSGNYHVLSLPSTEEGEQQVSPAALVNHSGQKVTLVPRRPGVLRLRVRDRCMPGAPPLQVEVRVSDIHSVELLPRATILRVGQGTEADVRALSNFEDPLDEAARQFIEFVPHADSNLKLIPSDEGRFTVRCLAAGTGSVHLEARTLSGHKVASVPQQIQCYPPLRLTPATTILLPGGSQQVRWSGCPSAAEIKFSTADGSVARVDASGTVLANRLGSTTLHAVCVGQDPAKPGQLVEFSSAQVRVIVQELGELRLHCPTNQLLVGAEMSVWARGPSGATPLTFGTREIEYRWEVLNPEIASVEGSSFSVRVVGRAEGTTRVTAFVRSAGHAHDTPLGSCQLTVTQQLQLNNGCTPCSLLLPPQSKGHIITNKDSTRNLHYALLSRSPSSQIDVDAATGVVTTGSDMGSAYVQVRDSALRGDVGTVVRVDSKPLHMLQVRTVEENVRETLPVGAEMHLRLVLRDEHGSAFDASEVAFEFEMNTYDVVSVRRGSTNHSLVARALRPGVAVLRVFVADQPQMQDFIRISSGSAIHPVNPVVHVGGQVRFTADLGSSADEQHEQVGAARWSSEDPSVVTVDELTGVATTHAEGVARIVLREGAVTTHTDVQVVAVHQIEFQQLGEQQPEVNNIPAHNGKPVSLRVPLAFKGPGAAGLLQGSAEVTHSIHHECKLLEDAWAYATPGYDAELDEYYCSVTPLGPRRSSEPAPRTVTLRVTAGDRKGASQASEQTKLAFKSGFVIQLDEEAIELNDQKQTYLLEVMEGNPETASRLVAFSSNSDKLSVTRVSQQASYSVFKVQVVDDSAPFRAQLDLLNSVTGQKLAVPVKFTGAKTRLTTTTSSSSSGGSSSASSPTPSPKVVVPGAAASSSTSWLLVVLIVMIALLLFYVLMYNTSSARTQSAEYGVHTPSRSWSSNDPRSPATPSTVRSPFRAALTPVGNRGWNQRPQVFQNPQ